MKATKIAMALAVIIAVGVMFTQRGGTADHLLVTDVMATPMPNADILITFKIENRGAPDRLLGAASPEARAHFNQRDAMTGAPLPANSAVEMVGEAAHITLSRLEGDATTGRLIPLTLTFAEAGDVAVKAQVREMAMSGMRHGGSGHGAMHMVPADAPKPALIIAAEPDGDGWRIAVMTENFTFSQAAADGPHEEGVGHGHLYVGGMKIGRVYGETARMGELPPGEHVIRVTLNTNDHRAYMVGGEAVTATTTIVVD